MAIQTINLAVPGGDTPRSANTKINANFSDQTNAASKLVGTANGQIPLAEGTFTATYTKVMNIYNASPTVDLNSLVDFPLGSRNALFHSPSYVTNPVDRFGTSWSLVETIGAHRAVLQTITSESKTIWRTASNVGGNLIWFAWHEDYSTRNTTKDANGFLKAASPIVKVFADKVELNGEAVDQDVTYKRNGIGDYTITTVSGLSTDGWYIELPKDMNGNPKVAVTLSEVDGVISLKTYKRIFSMETFTFEPDLDNPLDIPDTRWIDLRLNEIPAEEVNP